MNTYENFREKELYKSTNSQYKPVSNINWEDEAYLTYINESPFGSVSLTFESPGPDNPFPYYGPIQNILLHLQSHESPNFLKTFPTIGDKYLISVTKSINEYFPSNSSNILHCFQEDLNKFHLLSFTYPEQIQRLGPGGQDKTDRSVDWKLLNTLHQAIIKGCRNTGLKPEAIVQAFFEEPEGTGLWGSFNRDPKSYPDWRDTLKAYDMGYYSLQYAHKSRERPIVLTGRIIEAGLRPHALSKNEAFTFMFSGHDQNNNLMAFEHQFPTPNTQYYSKAGFRVNQDLEIIIQSSDLSKASIPGLHHWPTISRIAGHRFHDHYTDAVRTFHTDPEAPWNVKENIATSSNTPSP